jgi:hypothetical protein
MVNRKISLIFGIFIFSLLFGAGLVSAGYYDKNYGYENYRGFYSGYGGGFSNSGYKPLTHTTGSRYRDYDGHIYRSGWSDYRSYGSNYDRYNGYDYYDKSYVVDRYFPYFSYEYSNRYKESRSPYGYSSYSETSRRKLSYPEAYVVLWTYR